MFQRSSKWLRRILTDGRPLIWLLYKSLLPEDILFPSNVWLCVRNPTVWPFKWKPSNSIFFWQFFKAYFWLFESLDKGDTTLCATFSYKNKTSSAILSSGTIYLVCSFNFDVLRRNTASASKSPFACYSAQMESLLAGWKKYDGATIQMNHLLFLHILLCGIRGRKPVLWPLIWNLFGHTFALCLQFLYFSKGSFFSFNFDNCITVQNLTDVVTYHVSDGNRTSPWLEWSHVNSEFDF